MTDPEPPHRHHPVAALTVALLTFTAGVRARWWAWEERARADNRDAGYTTEAILITAILATLAIAAFAILGPKILAKVANIQL